MSKRALLVLLVAASAVTFVDRMCIAVMGPRMQDDLGISPERWGWVLGAFVLSYGLFQMPLGAWADRAGPRRVLAILVLWWSLFTGLTGFASGFAVLLAVRFLFGVGEAGAYPAMTVAVSRHLPQTERARAQGFIWAASRAGGALSPLLIVPVQQMLGWRAAFWILGVVGIVWVAAWWFCYREKPCEQPAASDRATRCPAFPWWQAVRSRPLWLLMSMYWCYAWGSWFYFSWLHTYLVKSRGFQQAEVALYSALPFVLGVFSNVAGGYISDYLSKRHGLRAGRCFMASACLCASALLLTMAALTTGKIALILLISLSFGVMDLMLPAAWAVCSDLAKQHAGTVAGAMNMAGNLGGFVCTVLFGYIATSFGYDAPLFLIAVMLVISAVLFSRIDPSAPLFASPQGAATSAR